MASQKKAVQKTIVAEKSQSSETSDNRPKEPTNMTIKVDRRQRLHWLIEAKKQRTSLTAAITEALNARFGEPE